jgi:hypothetical protein
MSCFTLQQVCCHMCGGHFSIVNVYVPVTTYIYTAKSLSLYSEHFLLIRQAL